jgi:hypothetical protein
MNLRLHPQRGVNEKVLEPYRFGAFGVGVFLGRGIGAPISLKLECV